MMNDMSRFYFVWLILLALISIPSLAQTESVRKGDIIDIGGVKAIVFSLDEYGHGTAMTINALRGKKDPWCSDKKIINEIVDNSKTDGLANTVAIIDYCEANSVPISLFPAFE